ncbi:LysE family translocator [Paraburkholderia sp. UCT70]|uniref:LysE family translocator n=1 Tax=Paraburkholderia sp. UCT70 TaxID=2991068 RepID=UPI003D1C4693
MPIHSYVSFLLASAVFVYSPGPVNVLTMSRALNAGWRAALPSVWGGTCAVLLQLAFTALCLNSLLLIVERALIVLRWAGAIYLVYLGFRQGRCGTFAASPVLSDSAGQRGLFWRGFATSGLNPKTLLFFPSFFPQFISTSSNEAHWSANHQYLLLGSTFALIFALGVASAAIFPHRLRTALQRPTRLRIVNRLMGSLLVGMGTLEQRHPYRLYLAISVENEVQDDQNDHWNAEQPTK